MVRLVLVAVASSVLLAQTRPPTFKSGARTVYVYATVQGKDGRLVPDLKREDFQISDNGKSQPITVFDNDPQHITLSLLFDMSGSMAMDFARIREAAGVFVDSLWPDDRARIGSFGTEVALSPLLTSDKPTLHRVLDEELWPGGGTPMWHATELAMKSLDAETGRRVILLLTDGEDSGMFVAGNRGDTRKHAERDGFMIYAIGLPGHDIADDLRSLSEDTGGGYYLVDQKDDLGASFKRVVEELHHQYVLGFSTETLDGRSHSLSVKTTKAGAKVRARKNYVASADAPGDIR